VTTKAVTEEVENSAFQIYSVEHRRKIGVPQRKMSKYKGKMSSFSGGNASYRRQAGTAQN